MIKLIKNRLFKKFIRSKPHANGYERKTKDYEHIKTMAFLLDGSDPIALRELLNRLHAFREDGKKLFYLGFVKKLPPFEDEEIIWVTAKDMNWFGIPKTGKIKHFMEREFDVLINTSMKPIRPLEYVSTYSKASLRIGKYDEKKTFCYDFMMRMENNDVMNFLDQVARYLKMVKSS